MKKLLTRAKRWSRRASGSVVPAFVSSPSRETTHAPGGVYVGHIDRITNGSIAGWAASRNDPNGSVKIRIYLDAVLSAEGLASGDRPDLIAAGHGNGQHGYELPVPKKALMCASRMTLKIVTNDGLEVVCEDRALRQHTDRKSPIFYMDASDLIEFLTHHRELSGIQRVQAGYLLGLGNTVIAGTEMRICARFKTSSFFYDVPYSKLAELLNQAGDAANISKGAWAGHIATAKAALTTRSEFIAGDTIFTMGAPWALDDHNETIRCAKMHDGVRYIQIFYDLIPISAPEYVAAPLIPHFARAMAAMTIYADHIFSISAYAQSDLTNTLQALDRQVPPISVIPMGGTITDSEQGAAPIAVMAEAPIVEGDFVLCVGTLEPRKNHMLLLKVWQHLVAKHRAGAVPKLVLVGRIGWYMEEFVRQLEATNFVESTIVHLEGVSNRQLSALYDACLFTIFPSFSEGWGLPITESLARGKICVCSNVTSMSEAGGSFVQYMDPYNTTEALSLCEKLIFDRLYRTQCEDVARGFKPPTWSDASEVLRSQIAEFIASEAKRAPTPSKPLEMGRAYRFDNIEARSSNASAKQVFHNFLQQEDALDLLVGWSWFGLDPNCTWSCGSDARIKLNIPQGDGSADAYIGLMIPQALDGGPCEVYFSDRLCGTFRPTPGEMCLSVPLGDVDGDHHLRLVFTGVRRNQADHRLLGFGLTGVTVCRRTDSVDRLKIIRGGEVAVCA